MSEPTLYSFRRCPWAMRARLALAVAGIRCQLREVDLKNKPAALLAASPKGTVPVLALEDGTVIDESWDILHWALTQHDPEDWLRSAEAAETLANDLQQHMLGHMIRYKYPERFAAEAIDPLAERQHCQDFFAKIDQKIADHQGAYLDGRTRSLVDMAIFPLLRQAARVDLDWFLGLPYPNLIQWYHLLADCALFKTVMHKYPVWTPDEAPVYFPITETPTHD